VSEKASAQSRTKPVDFTKRQSIMVSTSKDMVALTRALLATVWVNGNQEALLSLRT
jgi:hypothetical protein